MTAALLGAVAGAAGLSWPGRIYGRETSMLSDAATAQDLVTLLVLAPVLALLAVRARRGSLRAVLCLPGALAFAAYNDAIYAFSIHFGPLFLVWVAVLGLCTFALIGTLATADRSSIVQRLAGGATRGPAWFLVVVGTFFAVLWLGEIVPDLLTGGPSRSASTWDVPTNPVHVLDLAIFLPAVIMSGVLLRRRHPLGYATAAGQLVWLALTALPILITPVVSSARGHTPGWAVIVPVGALLVATLAVLARLLHAAGGRTTPPSRGT